MLNLQPHIFGTCGHVVEIPVLDHCSLPLADHTVCTCNSMNELITIPHPCPNCMEEFTNHLEERYMSHSITLQTMLTALSQVPEVPEGFENEVSDIIREVSTKALTIRAHLRERNRYRNVILGIEPVEEGFVQFSHRDLLEQCEKELVTFFEDVNDITPQEVFDALRVKWGLPLE